MAAIKVHGNLISTATNRVLATLYEKELEFEFVLVDTRGGEHKKEPFLSLHPFGQIPAFEDGDLKLFGNPADMPRLKKMAIILVWMETEAQKWDPAASKLAWELGIKPLLGMGTDTTIVEENEAKLAKVLDVYEKRLAQSKYLGGDYFTLADLHHLPSLQYLLGTQTKKLIDSRPHVREWAADITARPAWLKVLAMRNKH
ncbi:glutathione S-transferase-like [Fagus crenata]